MNNKEKDTFFEGFDRVEFSADDRKKVFEKLHTRKNKKFSFFRFKPVVLTSFLGVATVFLLMVLLSFPSEEKQDNLNSASTKHIQTGVLLVTDENFRASLNIVYSYNTNLKTLNVLSVPRDLYVPIFNGEGKEIGRDKMLHAYAYGGQEGVKKTLLNFFQIRDDAFSVLTEDEFTKFIDQIGGITMESGGKVLGGEEVLTSLSIRDLLTENEEKEHYELLSAVLGVMSEEPIELDVLEGIPEAVEINTINIAEKASAEKMEGIYYYKLEGEELEEVKSSLKQ
ncbi:LCP family protein [Sutcliffiella horikoshii]|uniref:LCP family glycopolymer transferase n=1 Tax=Sutcliffiella horikoshii TaxID=79883 RepID=UPI003CFB3683